MDSQLTQQQYIFVGVAATILLYRFDALPKQLNDIIESILPEALRTIIKPSKKVVVTVPLMKETPLPDGLKCDALDEKQCGLYPSACNWMKTACKPVEIKKQL
jgi:hypothetical protein